MVYDTKSIKIIRCLHYENFLFIVVLILSKFRYQKVLILLTKVIDALITYAGVSQRQEELFSSSDLFSRARSGFKGLKGVENVYTQHTPFLEKTRSMLTKGRL